MGIYQLLGFICFGLKFDYLNNLLVVESDKAMFICSFFMYQLSGAGTCNCNSLTFEGVVCFDINVKCLYLYGFFLMNFQPEESLAFLFLVSS